MNDDPTERDRQDFWARVAPLPGLAVFYFIWVAIEIAARNNRFGLPGDLFHLFATGGLLGILGFGAVWAAWSTQHALVRWGWLLVTLLLLSLPEESRAILWEGPGYLVVLSMWAMLRLLRWLAGWKARRPSNALDKDCQFTIAQVLLFTFAVAVLLALTRNLRGGALQAAFLFLAAPGVLCVLFFVPCGLIQLHAGAEGRRKLLAALHMGLLIALGLVIFRRSEAYAMVLVAGLLVALYMGLFAARAEGYAIWRRMGTPADRS